MDGRVTSAFTRVFDALCPAMTTSLALHRLRGGDELIERLAPAVAEAHAVVRIAIPLVLVHGEGGVFRSFSMRLHHDDRGEGRNIEGGIGRPVAGLKRHGPDELAVGHDLEEAADVGYLLTFRRAHHRAHSDYFHGLNSRPFLVVGAGSSYLIERPDRVS